MNWVVSWLRKLAMVRPKDFTEHVVGELEMAATGDGILDENPVLGGTATKTGTMTDMMIATEAGTMTGTHLVAGGNGAGRLLQAHSRANLYDYAFHDMLL